MGGGSAPVSPNIIWGREGPKIDAKCVTKYFHSSFHFTNSKLLDWVLTIHLIIPPEFYVINGNNHPFKNVSNFVAIHSMRSQESK